MNKKGYEEVQLLFVTYLILSIFIILSLFYIVERNLNDAVATKQFLARDLSLIMNMLYNSNADISINYNLNNPYEINVKNGNTKIKTEKFLVDFPESYPILQNGNYKDLDVSMKNFEKRDEELTIYNITIKKSKEEIKIDRKDI